MAKGKLQEGDDGTKTSSSNEIAAVATESVSHRLPFVFYLIGII